MERTDLTQRGIALHRYVSTESIWISAICLLDLVTTLYWVTVTGHAREGNPLMAYFLERGVVWFIAAKILMFAPAVAAAEWYRSFNPALVTRLMRWVIAGYLFLYIAGVAGHHGQVVEFYRQLLRSWLA